MRPYVEYAIQQAHFGKLCRAASRSYRDNLWTGVVRATAAGLQKLVCALQCCHAKVCNLDVALFVEQKVLWLQIAMADVETMTVVDTKDAARRECLASVGTVYTD